MFCMCVCVCLYSSPPTSPLDSNVFLFTPPPYDRPHSQSTTITSVTLLVALARPPLPQGEGDAVLSLFLVAPAPAGARALSRVCGSLFPLFFLVVGAGVVFSSPLPSLYSTPPFCVRVALLSSPHAVGVELKMSAPSPRDATCKTTTAASSSF